MERISSVLAKRRPSGVLAAVLTLLIAALIATMLPAVSTASDVGHGPHGLCVWPQPGRYSLGHTGITR